MDKNFDIYCGASLLVEATKYLYKHDPDFCRILAEKSKEYTEMIVIDEKLIEEVKAYGNEMSKRIMNEQS